MKIFRSHLGVALLLLAACGEEGVSVTDNSQSLGSDSTANVYADDADGGVSQGGAGGRRWPRFPRFPGAGGAGGERARWFPRFPAAGSAPEGGAGGVRA